jgi:hypothetical protein
MLHEVTGIVPDLGAMARVLGSPTLVFAVLNNFGLAIAVVSNRK